MNSVLALEIGADRIAYLLTQVAHSGTVRIADYGSVFFPQPNTSIPESEAPVAEVFVETTDTTPEQISYERETKKLVELAATVDSAVAIIDSPRLLYNIIELPFNDYRRINQVAPLQLQDILPFDIDTFIFDNIVLGEKGDGAYNILSTLCPTEDVKQALDTSLSYQINPRAITTRPSALGGLRLLFPDTLAGDFILVSRTSNGFATAAFVQDQIVSLRETPLDATTTSLPAIVAELRIMLIRSKRENENVNFQIFTTSNELAISLHPYFGDIVNSLPLSSVVENVDEFPAVQDEMSWALGITAYEPIKRKKAKKSELSLVNLRRGDFAYNPILEHLGSAFREELDYILIAILCLAAWVGTTIYTTSEKLDKINGVISQYVTSALGTTSIPEGREITVFTSKIADLEEQLKTLGSLSSLTPLELLKSLSTTIDKSVETRIESLTIAQGRLVFQGSVANYPQVGELQTLLKQQSKRFCDVKTDSKGQVPGSNRVKFTAEIKMCE